MAADKGEPAARNPRPLWAAITIAVVAIVLPGLLLGPLFVPFIVAWVVLAFALSFRRKFQEVRAQRLRNLSIYVFAAALVMAGYLYRLSGAQDRGEVVVAALKAFHGANRRYPEKLDELVPTYIAAIPPAMFGRFYYFNSAEAGPTFFYVTLPPFGRRGYCFAERIGACLGSLGEDKGRWYDFD